MSSFNKISNHSLMWKSRSTPGFIVIASLITLLGMTIGNSLPVDSIQAQPGDPAQANSGNGNAQANNSQNSDFAMQGVMSSYIGTNASDFVVVGNWTLNVEGGNLSNFNSEMLWSPTNVTAPNIKSHLHSFSNFIPNPNNEKIALMGIANNLATNQTISIDGVMDVGAGVDKTRWPGVTANLKIAGNTITISLDDSKTGGHFNKYPVFGKIVKTEKNQLLGQSTPMQTGAQTQQTNELGEQKDNLKLDVILKYSNGAVLADDEGDDDGVTQNLLQLQEYLKKESGDRVIGLPVNGIISK